MTATMSAPVLTDETRAILNNAWKFIAPLDRKLEELDFDFGLTPFTNDEVTALFVAAHTYVTTYTGDFAFIRSLQTRLVLGGTLSMAQAKGAMNTFRNECLDRLKAKRNAVKAQAPVVVAQAPVIETAPEARPAVTLTGSMTNATYTLGGGTEKSITIRIKPDYRLKKDEYKHLNLPADAQMAQYLSGSDNEHSYTSFAFVNGSSANIWNRFKADGRLAIALKALFAATDEERAAFGFTYAQESGNCWVCGRKLTVKDRIDLGIGAKCAAKLGM